MWVGNAVAHFVWWREREKREKEDHHLSLLGDFSYWTVGASCCNAIRQIDGWFWLFYFFLCLIKIIKIFLIGMDILFRIFFFDGIVFVAADRSALSHRFVLSQRRHLQILRSRWRTRLPVNWLIYFFLLCGKCWLKCRRRFFFSFLFCFTTGAPRATRASAAKTRTFTI